MRLDLDLDTLVDEVATRVAAELADRIASEAPSPWMAMEEAIAYTRIPAGTFRKWVAAGRILWAECDGAAAARAAVAYSPRPANRGSVGQWAAPSCVLGVA